MHKRAPFFFIFCLTIFCAPLIAAMDTFWFNTCKQKAKRNKSKLIFNNCGLNDLEIANLSTAILKESNAFILKLNKNKFGDAGLEALINVFPRTEFRFIWARSNYITTDGVQALCSFLANTDSKISYVDLRKNQISDECARYIINLSKIKPHIIIQTTNEKNKTNLVEKTLKKTIYKGPFIVLSNSVLCDFIKDSQEISDSVRAALVMQLIEQQANVNFQMPDTGYTALHHAAEIASQNKKTIAALCENGAQLDLREKRFNFTPLDIAFKYDFAENIHALILAVKNNL